MDLSWLTATPWPIIALSFAGVGALLALSFLSERRAQRRAERILREGEPAESTVLSATDTGWRTNGRHHIRLKLEVRRPGHPPYQAEARLMTPRWTPIPCPPGAVLPVRVDRSRPERVVIATGKPVLGGVMLSEAPGLSLGGGLVDFDSATIRTVSVGRVSAGDMIVVSGPGYGNAGGLPPEALADTDGNRVSDILEGAAPGRVGSAQRLRQLKAMYDEGLITAAEYEAKKAEILEKL